MKAFEEWWNKNKYTFISTDEKLVEEHTWKAACEWLLELAKEHDQELQFFIEDELDD